MPLLAAVRVAVLLVAAAVTLVVLVVRVSAAAVVAAFGSHIVQQSLDTINTTLITVVGIQSPSTRSARGLTYPFNHFASQSIQPTTHMKTLTRTRRLLLWLLLLLL